METTIQGKSIEQRYELALYMMRVKLEADLMDDLPINWKDDISNVYKIAQMSTRAEVLFYLTGDGKWNKDLEELKKIIDKEEAS